MSRLNLFLTFALMACALSLVSSVHQARQLFYAMETVDQQIRQEQIKMGQLELEISTLSTPTRVSHVAQDVLHMQPPSEVRYLNLHSSN